MEYIPNMRQRAQRRNWFKFRLIGGFLETQVGTQREQEIIDKINLLRKELIDNFDVESRKLGFIVPEHKCYALRCKCKVIFVMDTPDFGIVNVCKKHKKELEEIDGN